MTSVLFVLQNHLTESVNQQIQVFLRPRTIPPEADFFAWQRLNPAPGGQQGFDFTGSLQVEVAESTPQGSRSRRFSAKPGDRFGATSDRGQGPALSWQPHDQDGPASVENLTGRQIRVLWLSASRPIIEQRNVEERAVAELELIPDQLTFRIAERAPTARLPPPGQRTDYDYVFDPEATRRVWVTWTGEPGDSKLVFHPPSLAVEEVSDTAAKKPDAKKPDAKKPDAKKPDAKKPDAKKPDAKKPDAKKPDAKKPDAKKPDAKKKPGAKKPRAKKPAKRPEAKEAGDTTSTRRSST